MWLPAEEEELTAGTKSNAFYLAPVLLLLAALYGMTVPSQITLEDAGIFQMTCQLGGISHPPGYPLFTGLCQSLSYGETALVGNLLSVLFGLGAVAVLYFVMCELGLERFTAQVVAFTYGLTRCLWSQSLIIEVYTFAALLFMVSWWLLLRFVNQEQQRDWYLLCLFTGLSISNHWPLFILSCVGFLPFLVTRLDLFLSLLRPKTLVVSLGFVGLGLTPYVLLFQDNPEIAMYGAVTSDNFAPYFLREYYSDNHSGAGSGDKLNYLLWMFPLTLNQLGWLALPFVIIGAAIGVSRLGLKNYISILLIYFASTFLLVFLLNFRFEFQTRAVFQPYPVIAMVGVAVFLGIGLVAAFETLSQIRRGYGILLVVLVLSSIVVHNFRAVDRSESRLASEYARIVLSSLPQDALLLVGGDNQIGPIGFASRIQNFRPDVSVQSKDGLLFSDNLIPRNTSDVGRIELLTEFKQATGRRVFSVHQLSTEDVDYGLFYEFRGEGSRQVFLPEMESFAEYLIDLNINDLLNDAHEKVFAHSLLVSVTRLYSEFAIQVGTSSMTERQIETFSRLQLTLPGKLSSFRTLVIANPRADGLLPLGLALEAQLKDESIAAQHDALAFEYLGVVHLAQSNTDIAQQYFLKSLQHYPAETNGSACQYQKLVDSKVAAEVFSRYRLDTGICATNEL